MKNYTVLIPFTGYVSVPVKAETEEEAIQEAWCKATLDYVEEWDLHKRITAGNVCYAVKHGIEIYED